MKCDRCSNEATVHEVVVRSGKRAERHLCESCARAEGMAGHGHIPLTQLLNQFITSQLQAGAGAPRASGACAPGTCPGCGTSLARFRQTGLLGCPECYAAFEGQLSPLLQRTHEGGTHHQGKRPLRARSGTGQGPQPGSARPAPDDRIPAPTPPSASTGGGGSGGRARARPEPPGVSPAAAAGVAAMVARLRQQLADAVAAENYEQAARLRDEITRIEAGAGQASRPASRRSPKSGDRKPPTDLRGSGGPA